MNELNKAKESGYFSTVKKIQSETEGKLSDYTVSVKDCITVKGVETTAGSKILEGYQPVFDATAVKNVKQEGATIIGKTKQDEFGFGTFTQNTGIGIEPPRNPNDSERVTGGSSGGSAAATKILDNHISLAESTGGSIANPAAFCDVVGMTPTYGLVSRYGLIDYANSLDKIGVMTKTVKESATALDVISGHDNNDSTSIEKPETIQVKDLYPEKITLGIPEEYVKNLDEEIEQAFYEKVDELEDEGFSVKQIELEMNGEYSLSTYYIIAMAEASTNLARYSGLRYGYSEHKDTDYNDYFKKVRSNALGEEAKRRVILGTFTRMAGYRDAYYEKALKVRTKLINEWKETFQDVDAVIHPTMPIFPPKVEETQSLDPLDIYQMDLQTVGANLAGLPHLSVPLGTDLPSGFMITGDHLSENLVLSVGDRVER